MAAFAGRALFNCLWLTVACAGDRRSAAFRSPFVLGWYRRLPREIMCQSGRKSGAQLDIHTLCVCVCVQWLTLLMRRLTFGALYERMHMFEGHAHTVCSFACTKQQRRADDEEMHVANTYTWQVTSNRLCERSWGECKVLSAYLSFTVQYFSKIM